MVTDVPKGRYQHPVRLVFSVVSLSSEACLCGQKNQALQFYQAFGSPLMKGFRFFIIQSGSMSLPSYTLK